MNTVVRVLPPGRLASARSYIFCDEEFESGYMRASERGGASPYSRWISARKPKLYHGCPATARKRDGPVAHAYVYRIARKNYHLRRNRTRRHASPGHARCLESIRTR